MEVIASPSRSVHRRIHAGVLQGPAMEVAAPPVSILPHPDPRQSSRDPSPVLRRLGPPRQAQRLTRRTGRPMASPSSGWLWRSPARNPSHGGWGCERAVEDGSGEYGRRGGRRGPWGVRGRAARRRRSPETAGVGGGGGGGDEGEEASPCSSCGRVFFFFTQICSDSGLNIAKNRVFCAKLKCFPRST